ncbi:MAG TPA: DUF2267 domain-containing protein [Jatrophihabitans sp.]|nr:DUF2267 domain-containing protein [Jatrophihabitans sp.]
MTHTTHHPLDHLMQTANVWLAEIRDEFDTDDNDFVYRVTRAWLHALRDRLPVAESAHFAAQLPDVLRGVYYDGWRPSEVPVRCHPEQFVRDVTAAARITPAELTKVFGSVSDVMDRRLTNLDKVLGSVPAEIRVLLRP